MTKANIAEFDKEGSDYSRLTETIAQFEKGIKMHQDATPHHKFLVEIYELLVTLREQLKNTRNSSAQTLIVLIQHKIVTPVYTDQRDLAADHPILQNPEINILWGKVDDITNAIGETRSQIDTTQYDEQVLKQFGTVLTLAESAVGTCDTIMQKLDVLRAHYKNFSGLDAHKEPHIADIHNAILTSTATVSKLENHATRLMKNLEKLKMAYANENEKHSRERKEKEEEVARIDAQQNLAIYLIHLLSSELINSELHKRTLIAEIKQRKDVEEVLARTYQDYSERGNEQAKRTQAALHDNKTAVEVYTAFADSMHHQFAHLTEWVKDAKAEYVTERVRALVAMYDSAVAKFNATFELYSSALEDARGADMQFNATADQLTNLSASVRGVGIVNTLKAQQAWKVAVDEANVKVDQRNSELTLIEKTIEEINKQLESHGQPAKPIPARSSPSPSS